MKNYRVTWEIDVEAEDPRDAAEQVWRDIFHRGDPGPDDACVFSVSSGGNTPVIIDLSDVE